jgi:hypothetical protein
MLSHAHFTSEKSERKAKSVIQEMKVFFMTLTRAKVFAKASSSLPHMRNRKV